jgi:hypothetical protein
MLIQVNKNTERIRIIKHSYAQNVAEKKASKLKIEKNQHRILSHSEIWKSKNTDISPRPNRCMYEKQSSKNSCIIQFHEVYKQWYLHPAQYQTSDTNYLLIHKIAELCLPPFKKLNQTVRTVSVSQRVTVTNVLAEFCMCLCLYVCTKIAL